MESSGYVFVTPELSPYFKITGIGDLLQNIIGELARRKLRVAVICPDFGVDPRHLRFTKSMSIYSTSNGQPTSLQVKCARDDRGVDYFFIKDEEIQRYLSEASSLRLRRDKVGRNCLTFCYGAYLILDALCRGEMDFPVNRLVMHAFHWQTSPLVALIDQAPWRDRVRTVLTADILDIQGRFESKVLETHEIYRLLKPAFEQEINFLRLGIKKADVLHTVSPNYALEIQHAPNGRGLESLLRERYQQGRLIGILNGLDPQNLDWRQIPVLRDHDLAVSLKATDLLEQKQRAKLLFQRTAGLPQDPSAFLISMGHRFVRQKNFKLVVNAMEELMALEPRPQIYLRAWPEPCQDDADWNLWWQIVRFSKRFRHNLAFLSPFDRDQSLMNEEIFIDRFLYYAASDFFLMPSLWEPCGLCQLEAMHFGAIPLVTAVGGLIDTVKPFEGGNEGWGFHLEDPFDSRALVKLVAQAMDLWAHHPGVWQEMVRRAMSFESSITRTVDNYLERLYPPRKVPQTALRVT
jgi:starch synthase